MPLSMSVCSGDQNFMPPSPSHNPSDHHTKWMYLFVYPFLRPSRNSQKSRYPDVLHGSRRTARSCWSPPATRLGFSELLGSHTLAQSYYTHRETHRAVIEHLCCRRHFAIPAKLHHPAPICGKWSARHKLYAVHKCVFPTPPLFPQPSWTEP